MKKLIYIIFILIGSSALAQVEPAKDKWQFKHYDKFDGGLNLTQYSTKLPEGQFLDLTNARYNSVGSLYKREGFRKMFKISENDGAAGGLINWYPTADTNQYIAVFDDAAWTFSPFPSDTAQLMTKETSKTFKTKADYYWAQFFDRLYGCNGKDSNFYYDWNTQSFQQWGLIDSFKIPLRQASRWVQCPDEEEGTINCQEFYLTRNNLLVGAKNYVENDLVEFFAKIISPAPVRWGQIVRNVGDSIYFSKVALDTSQPLNVQIWNLPVSGQIEDSGAVVTVISRDVIHTTHKLEFVGNFSTLSSGAESDPYFIWIYAGKGAGFQELIWLFKDVGTTDTFFVVTDTSRWKSGDFDATSKWKIYRRLPLSSKFMTEFKGRYFYAGNYNSGVAGNRQPNLPNYLYFSVDVNGQAYYRPDWVKSRNFLNLDSRDGDIITGMTSQFQSTFANENDRLIVFSTQKIREVYVEATGFTPQDFMIFEVTNNLGCVAPRTIARGGLGGNTVFFLSSRGLYGKDPQNKFTFLSAPIQKHLDRIKKDYINNCAGAIIGNDYFLSTPDTSGAGSGRDTINSITWIYSFITGGWTKADIGAGMWFVSPLPSYKGRKSSSGMVAGLGTPSKPDTFQYLFTFPTQETIGTFGYVPTDTGKRIEMVIQTKRDDLGVSNFEKRFREIDLEYSKFDTSGGYIPALIDDTVYFEVYNDFDNTIQFADTSILSGNLNRRVNLNTKVINKQVSFKIKTKSPRFELARITAKYMLLNRRTR